MKKTIRFFIFSILILAFGRNVFPQNNIKIEEPKTQNINLKYISYFEVGLSYGTIAHPINFLIGYWIGPIGLNLAGMYYGRRDDIINGFQINIEYKILDDIDRRHSIGIVYNRFHDEKNYKPYQDEDEKDHAGYGAIYKYYRKGFFVEGGFIKEKKLFLQKIDLYNQIQLILQLGYIYRFIH